MQLRIVLYLAYAYELHVLQAMDFTNLPGVNEVVNEILEYLLNTDIPELLDQLGTFPRTTCTLLLFANASIF